MIISGYKSALIQSLLSISGITASYVIMCLNYGVEFGIVDNERLMVLINSQPRSVSAENHLGHNGPIGCKNSPNGDKC